MKGHQHKNKFSEKLEDYSSPLDLEEAWMDLEDRRRPKKRRSVLIFFFWGILISLVGISSWILYSLSINHDTVQVNNGTADSLITKTKEKSNLELNYERDPMENHNNIFSEQIKKTNAVKNDLQNIRTQNSKKEDHIFQKSYETSGESIQFLKKSSKTNSVLLENQNYSTTIPQSSVYFDPPILQKNEMGDQSAGKNDFKKVELTLLPSLNNYLHTSRNFQRKSTLGQIDFSDEIVISKKSTSQEDSLTLYSTNPTPKWSVEFSMNYGKLFRNITTTQSDYSELVGLKRSFEKPLDVMGGEVLLNYQVYPKFFISSGLGWQQRVLKLDDQFILNYKELRDNLLIEIIIDQDGNSSNVFGEGEVLIEETFFEKKYLRHQYASLPLLFGFNTFQKERMKKRKWKFKISTGMMYSFLVGQGGQTFGDSDVNGNYIELSSLPYRKNGVWQMTSRIGIECQLNSSLSASLDFRGDMDLNNVWKSEFGMKERYQQFGLQLGLKKQLKK